MRLEFIFELLMGLGLKILWILYSKLNLLHKYLKATCFKIFNFFYKSIFYRNISVFAIKYMKTKIR
jgi:hypothetical protein